MRSMVNVNLIFVPECPGEAYGSRRRAILGCIGSCNSGVGQRDLSVRKMEHPQRHFPGHRFAGQPPAIDDPGIDPKTAFLALPRINNDAEIHDLAATGQSGKLGHNKAGRAGFSHGKPHRALCKNGYKPFGCCFHAHLL